VDVYRTKGGYLRFYEVGEMAQVAGPMFLKVGASAQSHPYDQVGDPVGLEKVRRLQLVLEHLERVVPDAERIRPTDPQVCLPEIGQASNAR
jgi:hypothetical protein